MSLNYLILLIILLKNKLYFITQIYLHSLIFQIFILLFQFASLNLFQFLIENINRIKP